MGLVIGYTFLKDWCGEWFHPRWELLIPMIRPSVFIIKSSERYDSVNTTKGFLLLFCLSVRVGLKNCNGEIRNQQEPVCPYIFKKKFFLISSTIDAWYSSHKSRSTKNPMHPSCWETFYFFQHLSFIYRPLCFPSGSTPTLFALGHTTLGFRALLSRALTHCLLLFSHHSWLSSRSRAIQDFQQEEQKHRDTRWEKQAVNPKICIAFNRLFRSSAPVVLALLSARASQDS